MASNDLRDIVQSAVEDPSEKEVHLLRTSLRRCEGVIHTSAYVLSDKEQQTLKRIKKLRKMAGETRDLDIQIALLKSEEFDDSRFNGAPAELRSKLKSAREKASRRLAAAVKKALRNGVDDKAQKLCRKAKRELPPKPVTAIEHQIRALAAQTDLGDAEGLHQARIALKKVRYALEAYDDAALKETVAAMKAVHHTIGEWHDWVMLREVAEEHLSKRSPLVLHARRRVSQLFVRAADETARFFGPYLGARKPVASVKTAPAVVRARA